MNIKIGVSRFKIALYAYFKKSKQSNPKATKNILIIFQQIFGDGLIFSSTLKTYLELFPREEGYEITILLRPAVYKFLKDVVPLPDGIVYKAVDFKRLVEDYGYFKEILNEYGSYADTIIVPGTSMSAEIMINACSAKRKVGLISSTPVTSPFFRVIFYKKAYTETVVPDKEDMMLQRHRLLLNYLGATNYKAELQTLLPKESIIEGNYIVCCPGSSKMEKCWPTDRFVTVIDYVIEKYGLLVHLCGGADEIIFEEKIISSTKYPDKVISHIGKTNFSDWSAIVQHARLVIGNDSATMHLAAASRRKSICIAGVYDKYQFFPYKVDVLNEGDRLPVTILKDMPCEWCRTIGYDAGYGNEDCKHRIEQNQCSLCIDAITTEEVINKVDDLMRE